MAEDPLESRDVPAVRQEGPGEAEEPIGCRDSTTTWVPSFAL